MNSTRSRFARPASRILPALLLAGLSLHSARAADKFWTNAGNDFNTPENWIGSVPGLADRGIFGGVPSQNPILSAPIIVSGLTFFAPGYTVSGAEQLTLNSSVTNNDATAALFVASPGVTTISGPLVLGTTATGNAGLSAVMGGELVISGDISGSRGIQKMNFGTLTLSGNNTFTGNVNANGGNGNFGATRLNINSDTALGTGTFSVGQGNGGTTIGNTSGAAHTLANAINLGSGSGVTSIFNLPVNGSGDLTFTGPAALNGAGSTTGTVTVIGGTLRLLGGLTESTGTQALTKNGSGTLVLGGTVSNTGNVTFSGGAVVLDASLGGNFTNNALAAALTNTNFTYKGASTGTSAQTMSGTAAFTGRTGLTVDGNGGAGTTLTLSDTWTRNAASTLAIRLLGNGAVTANPVTSAGALVTGSGTVAFATVTDAGGTGFATVSGGNVVRFTGATPLTASGSDPLTNFVTKVGDPDYVGNTLTLSAGDRTLNTLHLDTSGGAGVLDLSGSRLGLTDKAILATGTNDFTIQNGVLGTASTEIAVHQFSTGTLTISGTVGSANFASSLVKDGPGTLVLAGANVSTGGTRVNEGTLNITGSVRGDLIATGSTVATSGTINLQSPAAVIGSTVSVAGAGTLNQTVANAISGTAAVTVNGFLGGATANLSMANDYTGQTTLTNGFLNLGNAAAIGTGTLSLGGGVLDNTSGAPMTLANNNPVNITGGFTFAGTSSLNLGAGGINLGTAARIVNVTANTLTFSSVLTGALGGITKIGAGTLVLNNANTYTGPTTVSSGMLSLGNPSAIGTGKLNLSGGTIDNSTGGAMTLSTNNAVDINGGFTFTGTSNLNLGTGGVAVTQPTTLVTLNGTNSSLTFGGAAANTNNGTNITLTVNGAGNTLTLGGYAISSGTNANNLKNLTINGSANVAITGAVIDSTGTGTLSTLTYGGTGTLTLAGANTYTGATNVNAGQLRVTGTLTGTTVNVNASASANFETSQTLPGLNIGDGAVVTLGALAPAVKASPAEPMFDSLSATSNIPEPGAAVSLLAGLGGLLGLRRIRRS